ncbi:MAG: hypothetical protein K6T54_04710 [Ignavibacterium sp.]|nr:hypothetical protein [Ignavibacterium sp.]
MKKAKNVKAKFFLRERSKNLVGIFNDVFTDNTSDAQIYDLQKVRSLRENPNNVNIS